MEVRKGGLERTLEQLWEIDEESADAYTFNAEELAEVLIGRLPNVEKVSSTTFSAEKAFEEVLASRRRRKHFLSLCE